MKKLLPILMIAIAAMATSACVGELKFENIKPQIQDCLVISAYTDDDVKVETKTTLSGVNVLWATTDNIKGFDGADVHTSTSTAVSDGNKKASFTFSTVSVEDDLLYLAYPAEKVSDIDDDYVYATIPTTQTATAGSFANQANVAVADGLTDTPFFKNVGGLLSFTINNDNITSVTLSANEDLTGDSKISMGSGTFAQATITSGQKSVTVSGTIANGSTYYAVVYPGTFTGLKIEVTNASGQVATYTNPNALTVGRNGNLHIATLTIPDGKWVTPTKGSAYTWNTSLADFGSSGSPKASISAGTPPLTWTPTYVWGGASASKYLGTDGSGRGVQVGAGSAANKCSSLTLTTTGYTDYIQNIRINVTGGQASALTASVSVGETALKNGVNTSITAGTTATNYVFSADDLVKGEVVISLVNSAAKALYIKSIEINPDLRDEQTLSFPQDAYSVELTEGTFTNPGLSGASTTVTYTSSDTDVATVNSSTGLVSLVSIGTATITATAAADEDYQEGSASYTLTVNPGPSSIAAVMAATSGDNVYTSGVVAQVNAKGFIMTDGTDNILVYQNATPSVVEGQAVKVSGKRGAYNNVPQISTPVITAGATGQSVVRTTKSVVTSSNCTGYTASEYVSLCGELTISGSYYNVAIDGSSVKGSLYQLVTAKEYSGSTISEMDGSVINVTGYVAGSNESYLNIAPVDIKFIGYEDPADAGYADNSSIDITVNANCGWTATKGTDANDIIKSVTYNSTTITVTFNANAGDEKTAQVVITPEVASGLPAVNVTVTQVASGASAVTLQYTLDGSVQGTGNSYAGDNTATQNGISWTINGNLTTNPWRIGGKSLTNVNRAIYSTTAMPANISQIVITHGAASSITVNSMTVYVCSTAAGAAANTPTDVVASFTPEFVTNGSVTIDKADATSWANCYYRIVYNVTVSGSSNKFIEFSNANFYGVTD